jgi:hypothetical protein
MQLKRELAIIGSYANTDVKLKLVESCILNCKQNGLDVLLYAKYPVPDKVHSVCDYYIFDKSNPIIPERTFIVWKDWGNKKMTVVKEEYGFAAIEQIINGLGFAYNLNYEFAYFFNYDVDLTNFTEYNQMIHGLSVNNDVVTHQFGRYDGNIGVLCTQLYFNVQKSFKALSSIVNLKHYIEFTTNTERLAEAFFHNCLQISNLKFHQIVGATLPELFSEQQDRLHGRIPSKHEPVLKYFEFLHLGSVSENPSLKKILIYFVQQEIHRLTVDIGTEILELTDLHLNLIELDYYILYEIDLIDKNPTQFKILKINNESMEETLDESLNDEYWISNFTFDI